MRFISFQKVTLMTAIFFLGASSPVFSASAAKQSFRTSFDCTKVKSRVEKMICENKELADADVEMASLYKSLLSSLSDSDKNQLKHEQHDWLKTRAFCGSSKVVLDCIKDVYAKRIDALQEKNETLNSRSADDTQTLSGNVDIPYTVHEGELHVLGFVLHSKEISGKEGEYYVSFKESPGRKWVVIGYDEPFEKTLIWLYDITGKAAPVPVKAKRVGKHFGVDWYGDTVFGVYWGGMGYKTSQLFSVNRPDVYTQIESIIDYDPIRDIYARYDFDKDFNHFVIVGRAFHPQTGEERFRIKLDVEDLETAIGSVENVRFGSTNIIITYQSESGVVTETCGSKIVENAKQ